MALLTCVVVGTDCQMGCSGSPSHDLSSSNRLDRLPYMADSRQHSQGAGNSCKTSRVLGFKTHNITSATYVSKRKTQGNPNLRDEKMYSTSEGEELQRICSTFYLLVTIICVPCTFKICLPTLKTPKCLIQSQHLKILYLPSPPSTMRPTSLRTSIRTSALLVTNFLHSVTSLLLCTSSQIDTVFLKLLTSCSAPPVFYPHLPSLTADSVCLA